MLIDALEKHGENWDEIEKVYINYKLKVFNGQRSKNDCILQLMQLPIRENIAFKLTDFKQQTDSLNDNNLNKNNLSTTNQLSANIISEQNNPLIQQVSFFAKMFEKFVENDEQEKQKEDNLNMDINGNNQTQSMKELIYKTYSKSIDNSNRLKDKESKKIKKIMNLLVYLQMKKVEMKLEYFSEFEKLISFEKQQIKSSESQIIQDRVKLAIKKAELIAQSIKIKETIKQLENKELNNNHNQINNSNIIVSNNNNEINHSLNNQTESNTEALDQHESKYLNLNH